MTRKDYVKIADALSYARAKWFIDPEAFESIVGTLADAFARDNPRFDRARFRKALVE